ncbi:uncharacterized protein LOC107821143 [Nicotiana tabacum]|uniref:Uncharacterized protein LOC107821143 n=1 Tax=Nicotiana tabacum TaxID=4097 RepID=A0A1S4CP51_TOBAC|nr:PREDICTED: uncharacterized protein LOC107821143 [Nicotiana tabacum]
MVVKMMKWRPWPPLSSKKFEAKITVNCLKGLKFSPDFQRLAVEIKWKGSKGNNSLSLSSLKRKSVKKNFTKEESLKDDDGVVHWNEEFQSLCNFSLSKDSEFHPWEVSFTVFNVTNRRPNHKVPIVAAASLNIAEFASAAREKEEEIEIVIPLEAYSGSNKSSLSLCLSLNLVELSNAHEASETLPKFVMSAPVSPSPAEVLSTDRNEISALKAGLQKVKLFKGLSTMRRKKVLHEEEGSDGRNSVKSDDTDLTYPVDTDSFGDSEEAESEEVKEDTTLRKSFSYETLAYANHAGGSYYSNTSGSEDEDLVYYSHHKSDAGHAYAEDATGARPNQLSQQSSKHRILPWRKRKLSFRSPKTKGEPLLKKYYGEEGGDDIDFDRRQLSSSDESSSGWSKSEEGSTANRFAVSEFGDDSFAVGSWEQKEIVSRDGQMKLQTGVFFASIDQRNERAAGESACTALVAVIADWFHSNPEEMPIKSQLDSLIREGSLEWRNLCENETYRERFPDKHFDLETVVQAKVRPLSVVPEKSFIGFFLPEGIEDEGFDFLKGAMSFDNIWDEISKSVQDNASHGESFVYIVSWNDHFFILKVEQDAYYIIDTLGERLYEGCNQAFILKFDRDTRILQLPSASQQSDDKLATSKKEQPDMKEANTNEGKIIVTTNNHNEKTGESAIICSDKAPEKEEESTVVCEGKEACKEYIKSFLAAIPIRELEVDVKKGLMASTLLHQMLQIEFHYTKSFNTELESPPKELTANSLALPSSEAE